MGDFNNRISLENHIENSIEEEKSSTYDFENVTPIKQMRSIKEEEEIEEWNILIYLEIWNFSILILQYNKFELGIS